MQRQTTLAKPLEIKRNWYLVDATDIPLGRLASKIAVILMGKNKPTFTPNVDCGDYIVVINASKVKMTGNHPDTKKNYYNVSEYNGGLRTRSSGVMKFYLPSDRSAYEKVLNENYRRLLKQGRTNNLADLKVKDK